MRVSSESNVVLKSLIMYFISAIRLCKILAHIASATLIVRGQQTWLRNERQCIGQI